ncbi:MAG: hypothetical protein ACYSWZ_21540 [Planctomycetota bacterium]
MDLRRTHRHMGIAISTQQMVWISFTIRDAVCTLSLTCRIIITTRGTFSAFAAPSGK